MIDIIDLAKARQLNDLTARKDDLEARLAALTEEMERARIRCICGEGLFSIHQTTTSLHLTCQACGVEGQSTMPVFRTDDE